MDGRYHSIQRNRAFILDIVRLAQKVPSFPVDRWMDLNEVAEARQALPTDRRVSWAALFMKAYGYVSAQHEELRRSYVCWPWPRYYQNPYSLISISVNRPTPEGDTLYFGQLHAPEEQPLLKIQRQLTEFQTEDVRQRFKQQHSLGLIPGPLRRVVWFWRLQVAVKKRAKRFGTGSISTLAGQGCSNRLHPCMLTSSLSYSPLAENGWMQVTLQCDHRILDGVPAARAILSMEEYLQQDLLEELRELKSARRLRASQAA